MGDAKKVLQSAVDQLTKGPTKAWNRLRRTKDDLVANLAGPDGDVTPLSIVVGKMLTSWTAGPAGQ
jgi:hypothetical protein